MARLMPLDTDIIETKSGENILQQRLQHSHAVLETERTFSEFQEMAIVAIFLDNPEFAKDYLKDISHEHFTESAQQLVMAEIINAFNEHGEPPTRGMVESTIKRQLTVDHPLRKEIIAVLDYKPRPVEVTAVTRDLQDWMVKKTLSSNDAMSAFASADITALDQLLDKVKRIKNYTSDTSGPFKNGLTGDDLLAMEVPPTRWLVDNILSDAGFFVIGGPLKTMKTSILLDLAVSLASGTPFMNEFKVTEPVKVALITVETNKNEMVTKLKRVAAARGVTSLSNLRWEAHAPRLTSKDYLAEVRAYLKEHKPRVMIVDPLYVSLEGAEHANIMSMGPILNEFSQACQEAGCIPGAVHHFNRKGDAHDIPTLQDLSQAGCGEFARQWLLLRRREAYKHDNRHQLWFVSGGSDGHAANHHLTITEGGEKGWHAIIEEHGEAVQRDRSLKNDQLTGTMTMAIDYLEKAGPVTTKKLTNYMELNKTIIQKGLKILLAEGIIQEYDAVVSHNPCKCYRRLV